MGRRGPRAKAIDDCADVCVSVDSDAGVRTSVPTDSPTTAELVGTARQGNAEAWSQLVARYERLVFAVARRSGLSRDDAADVSQQTFMAFVDAIHEIRHDERLAAWLVTVASRQAGLVARTREVPADIVEGSNNGDHDPTAEWHQTIWVYDAIALLPEPCRELLTAMFLDSTEPSYAELSLRLERPIGSLGSMRARCLERLRVLLEADSRA